MFFRFVLFLGMIVDFRYLVDVDVMDDRWGMSFEVFLIYLYWDLVFFFYCLNLCAVVFAVG